MAEPDKTLAIPPPETTNRLSDIHDIHPLVDIPSRWDWLFWAVPLLLLALAVTALLLWLRHRHRHRVPEVIEHRAPPHERARRMLEEALAFLHDPDRFCVLVSRAIRQYLEQRFSLRAPERTTEEFLAELRTSSRLGEEHKILLAEFLAECDLVKFARSSREAHELSRLHEAALRLVRETEPGIMDCEENP